MLHKTELPSYVFPLGAAVTALGLVAGIAQLTERAIGLTPAIVAEPTTASVAEAARSQLIPERVAEPSTVAEPASAGEPESAAQPPTVADPASAAEPTNVAEPASAAESPTVAEPASAAAPPTAAEAVSAAKPPAVAEPASVGEPSIVVAAAPPDAPAASDPLPPDLRAAPKSMPIPKPRLATKTPERGIKAPGRSQAAVTRRSALVDRLRHKAPAARLHIRTDSPERRESSVVAPVASEAAPPKPRAVEKILPIPKPDLASKTSARILQPPDR